MAEINDIISSLSEDDIGMLKNMASSIFGKGEKSDVSNHNSTESEVPNSEDSSPAGPQSELGLDPEMISKIVGILGALKSSDANDSRTNFLISLKPMLSTKRQQKADEAIKMIHLMDILPLLKNQGLF